MSGFDLSASARERTFTVLESGAFSIANLSFETHRDSCALSIVERAVEGVGVLAVAVAVNVHFRSLEGLVSCLFGKGAKVRRNVSPGTSALV